MEHERATWFTSSTHRRRAGVVAAVVISLASLTGLSAHVIKGLLAPTLATAFVSSPTAGTDSPIRIAWGTADTGLRVVCFYVANTSTPRVDRPDWPRVAGVGFELPGTLSGFSLVAPLDGGWELVEGTPAILPGRGSVTLDFALVTRVNPGQGNSAQQDDRNGIPPGQAGVRGSGMRFCVSGPFPDQLIAGQPTTIEQILNGVVVAFNGVEGTHRGLDSGIWDNAARIVPLYPQ